MNREDRGVLYGLAIGDGRISYRTRYNKDKDGIPKYEYTTAELVLGHGPAQLEYLIHKRDLLHSLLGGKKNSISKTSTTLSNGKTYPGYRMAKTHTYFRQMHGVLYPYGKKYISDKVLTMLTPHSLALWYMDDGSMSGNKNKDGLVTSSTCSICTQVSEEEIDRIVEWFGREWGLEARKYKAKGKYDFAFRTKASHRFADIVWPYMHPSMHYKFRHLEDFILRTSARQPTKVEEIVRPNENKESLDVQDKELVR